MDGYSERVLIGEIYLGIPELVKYYGPQLLGAQMPFNFHLIQTAWQAELIADLIRRYEAALPAGAWPNWVMGNHDQHRLATRIGPEQARVAAVLILTLRGTPTLYYGDELGMPDAVIPPELVQDPAEKKQPGMGFGRDPERSPMVWDPSATAGFTTGTPWLPLISDHAGQSVAVQDGGRAVHAEPVPAVTGAAAGSYGAARRIGRRGPGGEWRSELCAGRKGQELSDFAEPYRRETSGGGEERAAGVELVSGSEPDDDRRESGAARERGGVDRAFLPPGVMRAKYSKDWV